MSVQRTGKIEARRNCLNFDEHITNTKRGILLYLSTTRINLKNYYYFIINNNCVTLYTLYAKFSKPHNYGICFRKLFSVYMKSIIIGCNIAHDINGRSKSGDNKGLKGL